MKNEPSSRTAKNRAAPRVKPSTRRFSLVAMPFSLLWPY
jgi:hypothetical protein